VFYLPAENGLRTDRTVLIQTIIWHMYRLLQSRTLNRSIYIKRIGKPLSYTTCIRSYFDHDINSQP